MRRNTRSAEGAQNSNGAMRKAYALFRVLASSPARSRILLIVIALTVVIVATAFGQVKLNAWNKPFYDAIERRDISTFLSQLVAFGVIAGSLIFLNIAQTWLDQTLKLELRNWLASDLITQWMSGKRAFHIVAAGLMSATGETSIDPDQRIHDDTRRLTELTAALAIGCFQSALLLASFSGVLWSLSREFALPLNGTSIVIPGFMLWCALIYAASGTWLSRLAGRPLIKIGETRAAREGDLRSTLVRVNEAIDGISLARGEWRERQRLERALAQVIIMMRVSAARIASLTLVTASYGWVALVVPIVVAAPPYFAGDRRRRFG